VIQLLPNAQLSQFWMIQMLVIVMMLSVMSFKQENDSLSIHYRHWSEIHWLYQGCQLHLARLPLQVQAPHQLPMPTEMNQKTKRDHCHWAGRHSIIIQRKCYHWRMAYKYLHWWKLPWIYFWGRKDVKKHDSMPQVLRQGEAIRTTLLPFAIATVHPLASNQKQ